MLTTNNDQKPVINLDPGGNSSIDLEAIIEQIWKDLAGTASRSDIRSVVIEVAPRYTQMLTFSPMSQS
jgi:hypothetical protein